MIEIKFKNGSKLESIELRIHFGNLEWRDWEKHKKWHGIETNM